MQDLEETSKESTESLTIFGSFMYLFKISFPDDSEVQALVEGRLPVTPEVSRRVFAFVQLLSSIVSEPYILYGDQKQVDATYAEWLKNR